MVAVDVIQARTISKKAAKYLRSHNPLLIPDPSLTQGFADSLNNLIAAQMAPILQHTVTSFGLSVSDAEKGGTATVEVRPGNIREGREHVAGFFVHGGGFALLSAHDYNAYRMAHDLGIVTYSVDYSLSPEVQFPVALNETVNAYNAVAEEYDEVLVAGSSAGGNLLITTILQALTGDADPPKAAGLFAPEVDLRMIGDSYVANDGRDPYPSRDAVSKLNAAYLGTTSAAAPKASPIRADYSAGFVPTIITTGTRDLLQSDSVRLYWKLRHTGASVRLRIWEGMWHNFEGVAYLPEGERNMREVFGFLEEHI